MTDKNALDWIIDFIRVGIAAVKKHNVELGLEDLFPPDFVQAHSTFESIETLLAAAGERTGVVDLESDDWDGFVAENTDFDGWETMKEAGLRQWKIVNLELDRLNG